MTCASCGWSSAARLRINGAGSRRIWRLYRARISRSGSTSFRKLMASLLEPEADQEERAQDGIPALEGDHLGVPLHLLVVDLAHRRLAHLVSALHDLDEEVGLELVFDQPLLPEVDPWIVQQAALEHPEAVGGIGGREAEEGAEEERVDAGEVGARARHVDPRPAGHPARAVDVVEAAVEEVVHDVADVRRIVLVVAGQLDDEVEPLAPAVDIAGTVAAAGSEVARMRDHHRAGLPGLRGGAVRRAVVHHAHRVHQVPWHGGDPRSDLAGLVPGGHDHDEREAAVAYPAFGSGRRSGVDEREDLFLRKVFHDGRAPGWRMIEPDPHWTAAVPSSRWTTSPGAAPGRSGPIATGARSWTSRPSSRALAAG